MGGIYLKELTLPPSGRFRKYFFFPFLSGLPVNFCIFLQPVPVDKGDSRIHKALVNAHSLTGIHIS